MLRQTPAQSDSYAAIAPYYDLEHDQFEDDLPLYRHVVEMVGDPVIEFACGSGRILHTLEDGHRRLTGLDSSHVMLARCRNRFADSALQPLLLDQDMSQPDLPDRHFGVCIIGLNSLMHATTPASQLATLAAAHRALDPRGLLVIDLMNPLHVMLDSADNRVRMERTLVTAEGKTVTKFSSQDIDLAEQLITSSIWYDVVNSDDSLTRYATSAVLRFIFRSELELMIQTAGFPKMHFYGSYDLDPYSASSPRLIAFAECS